VMITLKSLTHLGEEGRPRRPREDDVRYIWNAPVIKIEVK
jgi:hypothetical protein